MFTKLDFKVRTFGVTTKTYSMINVKGFHIYGDLNYKERIEGNRESRDIVFKRYLRLYQLHDQILQKVFKDPSIN